MMAMNYKRMNNDGFVNLMEAVMEQAYKDVENEKDEILSEEAKRYIETMQKSFA